MSELVDSELVFSPIPQLDGLADSPAIHRTRGLDVPASPTLGEVADADDVPQHGGHAQDSRNKKSILEEICLIAQQINATTSSRATPTWSGWRTSAWSRETPNTHVNSTITQENDEGDEEEDEEDDEHLSDLIRLVQRQKSMKNRRN